MQRNAATVRIDGHASDHATGAVAEAPIPVAAAEEEEMAALPQGIVKSFLLGKYDEMHSYLVSHRAALSASSAAASSPHSHLRSRSSAAHSFSSPVGGKASPTGVVFPSMQSPSREGGDACDASDDTSPRSFRKCAFERKFTALCSVLRSTVARHVKGYDGLHNSTDDTAQEAPSFSSASYCSQRRAIAMFATVVVIFGILLWSSGAAGGGPLGEANETPTAKASGADGRTNRPRNRWARSKQRSPPAEGGSSPNVDFIEASERRRRAAVDEQHREALAVVGRTPRTGLYSPPPGAAEEDTAQNRIQMARGCPLLPMMPLADFVHIIANTSSSSSAAATLLSASATSSAASDRERSQVLRLFPNIYPSVAASPTLGASPSPSPSDFSMIGMDEELIVVCVGDSITLGHSTDDAADSSEEGRAAAASDAAYPSLLRDMLLAEGWSDGLRTVFSDGILTADRPIVSGGSRRGKKKKGKSLGARLKAFIFGDGSKANKKKLGNQEVNYVDSGKGRRDAIVFNFGMAGLVASPESAAAADAIRSPTSAFGVARGALEAITSPQLIPLTEALFFSNGRRGGEGGASSASTASQSPAGFAAPVEFAAGLTDSHRGEAVARIEELEEEEGSATEPRRPISGSPPSPFSSVPSSSASAFSSSSSLVHTRPLTRTVVLTLMLGTGDANGDLFVDRSTFQHDLLGGILRSLLPIGNFPALAEALGDGAFVGGSPLAKGLVANTVFEATIPSPKGSGSLEGGGGGAEGGVASSSFIRFVVVLMNPPPIFPRSITAEAASAALASNNHSGAILHTLLPDAVASQLRVSTSAPLNLDAVVPQKAVGPDAAVFSAFAPSIVGGRLGHTLAGQIRIGIGVAASHLLPAHKNTSSSSSSSSSSAIASPSNAQQVGPSSPFLARPPQYTVHYFDAFKHFVAAMARARDERHGLLTSPITGQRTHHPRYNLPRVVVGQVGDINVAAPLQEWMRHQNAEAAEVLADPNFSLLKRLGGGVGEQKINSGGAVVVGTLHAAEMQRRASGRAAERERLKGLRGLQNPLHSSESTYLAFARSEFTPDDVALFLGVDGVHPTRRGHSVIADALFEFLSCSSHE